ncbi:MAG: DUF4856 domain-containing protein [Bacteroidota bacterium]
MKKLLLPIIALGLAITIQSCKKDKVDGPTYTVPTTYNFDSVDYSGQTYRLQMISELVTEIRKGTTGVAVDGAKLLNMYTNTGSPFVNSALNTSGKQLKDKTFAADQATIEAWITAAAALGVPGSGSNGTAGIVIANNGTSKYLLDANGYEYKEAVEKHLQGALVYYQITEVYLSNDKVGSAVALADRQHHWDEAFGYFGVPTDYPTNKTGLLHVGKYASDRDSIVGNATKVMNAFIKGRAAINSNDNETVTEQIAIIRDNVEKGVAATAVHYINGAIRDIANVGACNHQLSESYFLVKSLKYNSTKKVTDTQIQTLLAYFGANFYEVTVTDLQAAKDLLSSIYGFDSYKDQL